MKHLVCSLITSVAVIMAGFAAVHAAEETPAPAVEKAPFHVPAFRNDLVTILSVYIPAGRTAPYHKHSIDYAYVFVRPAKTKAQTLGEQPIERQLTRGAAAFVNYTKKPAVHQVANIDTEPFWVVGAEIMYPEPGRFSPSSRTEVPDYKMVLDNERVRMWHLALQPGQSVGRITQTAPGLRIVVEGGELLETQAGSEQNMVLKVGEYQWQDAGVTRSVRNVGNSPIEIVEFELK